MYNNKEMQINKKINTIFLLNNFIKIIIILLINSFNFKIFNLQTLKEIEIILINDFSNDNTLEISKKMNEKDSRIKIINNNRNRGLLYSRAMGIFHSKGQYLMNLDPDDELKDPDNLEYLYNKAKEAKVDVVSFGYEKEENLSLIFIYLFI